MSFQDLINYKENVLIYYHNLKFDGSFLLDYLMRVLELKQAKTELNNQVKELRSEFVDRRSELMKLKMESTVAKKMETRQILPSEVPPLKVVVEDKESKKSFWDKLKIWQ